MQASFTIFYFSVLLVGGEKTVVTRYQQKIFGQRSKDRRGPILTTIPANMEKFAASDIAVRIYPR